MDHAARQHIGRTGVIEIEIVQVDRQLIGGLGGTVDDTVVGGNQALEGRAGGDATQNVGPPIDAERQGVVPGAGRGDGHARATMVARCCTRRHAPAA